MVDGKRQTASSRELHAPLLAMLRAAGGEWLAAQEIARSLDLGRLPLERELERLESFGFCVEREDSRLKLVAAPDLLFPDEIRHGLDTRVIGREVVVYDEIGSTNDAAWELAANGCNEGAVVFAEEQTRGRGRLGRKWYSPRGGLWMSILLRLEHPAERATLLTMAASVAVAGTIRAYPGCNATIRWPNDILVGEKKVAGVLVETRSTARLREAFVLGIGIDVSSAALPPELKAVATTLARHSSKPICRTKLARLILRRLDEMYLQILNGEHTAIGKEWSAMSSSLGRNITIIQNGRTYKGEVVDIDPIAGLMVRLDRGFVRAFRGEHVTVVK